MNHPFKDMTAEEADKMERILRRASGLAKGEYRTGWAWKWNEDGRYDLVLVPQSRIGVPAAISITYDEK